MRPSYQPLIPARIERLTGALAAAVATIALLAAWSSAGPGNGVQVSHLPGSTAAAPCEVHVQLPQVVVVGRREPADAVRVSAQDGKATGG